MLIKVFILTGLIFGVLYPLRFWIRIKTPVKDSFRKFHLGLPNTVGGITVVLLMFMNIPLSTKGIVLLWKAVLVIISRYSWKKEYPDARLMSIPPLMGMYAFVKVQNGLIGDDPALIVTEILGGVILCCIVFILTKNN